MIFHKNNNFFGNETCKLNRSTINSMLQKFDIDFLTQSSNKRILVPFISFNLARTPFRAYMSRKISTCLVVLSTIRNLTTAIDSLQPVLLGIYVEVFAKHFSYTGTRSLQEQTKTVISSTIGVASCKDRVSVTRCRPLRVKLSKPEIGQLE